MHAAIEVASGPEEVFTPAPRPPALEVVGMRKRFGNITALEDVSLKLQPGTFHALLGENGAGKSTLVKCIMGYQPPDEGAIVIGGCECDIRSTTEAHRLGLGMVYQHFTLVPNMTVLENLLISRTRLPLLVNWSVERARLEAIISRMPFRLPLDTPVRELAAGEKQKVEILKQLVLDRRVLILDESSSVLTPEEVDEVFGMLREKVDQGELSVLMITHKFREVMTFADEVTVLRHGRLAGKGKVSEHTPASLAAMMIGVKEFRPLKKAAIDPGATRLRIQGLRVENNRGIDAVHGMDLEVRAGEIVGIAGVSGNGQRELVEALSGQREIRSGTVRVHGETYRATRREMQAHRIGFLPEEPLHNAAVAEMSVADNLAFRSFDRMGCFRWLVNRPAMRTRAATLIRQYKVKTSSPSAPIATLSGGNVQRAILGRELSEQPDVLVVANPCFGLDFAATAEIRSRLLEARARGAAVLLVSEDLDELLELSDRLVVMSEGRAVYEVPAAQAERAVIGQRMAGH